jgi:hypothetical protein
MALNMVNLDETTRRFMLEEIELDISNGKLYISPRLSDTGRNDYATLLKEAAENHDDTWLAQNLRLNGRISATEQKRTPSGGITTAKVPVTAPDTLAEGEFNRFYIRGLCRLALEEGVSELVIYRAKQVSSPRPESQAKVGTKVEAQALLNDLRVHQGVDTALGLPAGPNSGLSVKLP